MRAVGILLLFCFVMGFFGTFVCLFVFVSGLFCLFFCLFLVWGVCLVLFIFF